jgi:hypothetical protein
MPIVRLTLKIDVLKMEWVLFMGYCEGERAFYVYSTNWKGEEEKVCTYNDTWNFSWKEKNVEFEKFLVEDLNLCWLSRKNVSRLG